MSSVVRLSRRSHARALTEPDIIRSYDFRSVYQPILSPTHQKLVGFEALVRVSKHDQPVSPLSLFEQAATLGQTPTLDRHLLHLHLANFAAGESPVWLFLNINLTPACIPTPRWNDWLHTAKRRNRTGQGGPRVGGDCLGQPRSPDGVYPQGQDVGFSDRD